MWLRLEVDADKAHVTVSRSSRCCAPGQYPVRTLYSTSRSSPITPDAAACTPSGAQPPPHHRSKEILRTVSKDSKPGLATSTPSRRSRTHELGRARLPETPTLHRRAECPRRVAAELAVRRGVRACPTAAQARCAPQGGGKSWRAAHCAGATILSRCSCLPVASRLQELALDLNPLFL